MIFCCMLKEIVVVMGTNKIKLVKFLKEDIEVLQNGTHE